MTASRKRICILGSTGSIGVSTLRVIEDHPERFEVVGLSAHGSGEALARQAERFDVMELWLSDANAPIDVPGHVRVWLGPEAYQALITVCKPDLVVVATVGYAGLEPTLFAIDSGIPVALANKEVLVTAGELVMAEARSKGVPILPIDSEHNAIFQCVDGRADHKTRDGNGAHGAHCAAALRRIILTASGGPFRGFTHEQLALVSREQALAHPTWRMGRKITIDSATLMNKGFEVIEAHHLFGLPAEKIEVVVHPQSVIHGMIEFHDGSMLAQLGVTDMYLPIANVLAYPERLPNARFEPLDLARLGALTFEAPAPDVFPCLRYAFDALRAGGTYGAVLNAANEVAVTRFLAGECRFSDIPETIDAALQAHRPDLDPRPTLEGIAEADAWTRRWCAAHAPALKG